AIPSAVVLDLRLPDGRGEKLLEILKGDPATAHVPVIVVTVDDDEGQSQRMGADDHLTKPIDHERLERWPATGPGRAVRSHRAGHPDAEDRRVRGLSCPPRRGDARPDLRAELKRAA